MKVPPFLIDLGVWLVLAVVFLALATLSLNMMRPPTAAAQMVAADDTLMDACQAWDGSLAVPPALRTALCRCMVLGADGSVNRLYQQDPSRCRGIVRRFASAAEMDQSFEDNFPSFCGELEGQLTGGPTDGRTPFCQCLKTSVAADYEAKLLYAQGEAEPPSQGRKARIRACVNETGD